MKRALTASVAMTLLAAAAAMAHPHFNKTVTAKLPSGVEATITYGTTPANEIHAAKAAVGAFVTPRRPLLKLSGEIKTGALTIPAGDYTIGVIKNSETDWTMALYPGVIPRGGEAVDAAKAIKLDSLFSTAQGTAEHMLLDISPGDGKLEGRAVLTLHFGHLFLAGALSDKIAN